MHVIICSSRLLVKSVMLYVWMKGMLCRCHMYSPICNELKDLLEFVNLRGLYKLLLYVEYFVYTYLFLKVMEIPQIPTPCIISPHLGADPTHTSKPSKQLER